MHGPARDAGPVAQWRLVAGAGRWSALCVFRSRAIPAANCSARGTTGRDMSRMHRGRLDRPRAYAENVLSFPFRGKGECLAKIFPVDMANAALRRQLPDRTGPTSRNARSRPTRGSPARRGSISSAARAVVARARRGPYVIIVGEAASPAHHAAPASGIGGGARSSIRQTERSTLPCPFRRLTSVWPTPQSPYWFRADIETPRPERRFPCGVLRYWFTVAPSEECGQEARARTWTGPFSPR